MPERTAKANAAKSKVRARAETEITLANLAFNMQRRSFCGSRPAAAAERSKTPRNRRQLRRFAHSRLVPAIHGHIRSVNGAPSSLPVRAKMTWPQLCARSTGSSARCSSAMGYLTPACSGAPKSASSYSPPSSSTGTPGISAMPSRPGDAKGLIPRTIFSPSTGTEPLNAPAQLRFGSPARSESKPFHSKTVHNLDRLSPRHSIGADCRIHCQNR